MSEPVIKILSREVLRETSISWIKDVILKELIWDWAVFDLPATIVADPFPYPTFCRLAPVPIPQFCHFERALNICLSVHHMLEWFQCGVALIFPCKSLPHRGLPLCHLVV
jgi:hypothetical protein